MRFGVHPAVFVFSLVAGACSWMDEPASSSSAVGSTGLVISQVYGGGGNTGATYTNDFVELFNRGTTDVALAGLSVQYASATGSSWQMVTLSGSVPAGRYYLIQLAGGTNGAALPAADKTGTISMAATAGKVALVNGTTALTCGAPFDGGVSHCAGLANVIDFVGYGTSANDYEGAGPTPAPSAAKSAQRSSAGCQDNDENAADFEALTAVARNSATPANLCVDADGGGVITADLSAADLSDVDLLQPDDLSVPVDLLAAPDLLGAPDLLAVPDLLGAPDLYTPPVGAGLVVISQIYGGGGNSAATYTNDYIELFNRSQGDVSLKNLSIQHAAANGTIWTALALPDVIIPAGRYFLIALAGGATGAALPAADLTGTINLGGSSGKVALVNGTAPLGCAGACASTAPIIDFVGYGSTANDYEGAAATGPSTNAKSLFRLGGGCIDTNDNAADTLTATAAARNSATPFNDCSNVMLPDLSVQDLSVPHDLSTPGGDAAVVVDLAVPQDLSSVPPADLHVAGDLSTGTPRHDAGCTCTLGGRSPAPGAGWLVVLLLGLVARRSIRGTRRSA